MLRGDYAETKRRMLTFLGTADAFFDGVGEVRLTCANVGTKDVRSVTCYDFKTSLEEYLE